MDKQFELNRFQQLARMADDAFRKAHSAEYEARVAKAAVMKLQAEIIDRVESLEIDLGIPPKEQEPEESEDEHEGRQRDREDDVFGARRSA